MPPILAPTCSFFSSESTTDPSFSSRHRKHRPWPFSSVSFLMSQGPSHWRLFFFPLQNPHPSLSSLPPPWRTALSSFFPPLRSRRCLPLLQLRPSITIASSLFLHNCHQEPSPPSFFFIAIAAPTWRLIAFLLPSLSLLFSFFLLVAECHCSWCRPFPALSLLPRARPVLPSHLAIANIDLGTSPLFPSQRRKGRSIGVTPSLCKTLIPRCLLYHCHGGWHCPFSFLLLDLVAASLFFSYGH